MTELRLSLHYMYLDEAREHLKLSPCTRRTPAMEWKASHLCWLFLTSFSFRFFGFCIHSSISVLTLPKGISFSNFLSMICSAFRSTVCKRLVHGTWCIRRATLCLASTLHVNMLWWRSSVSPVSTSSGLFRISRPSLRFFCSHFDHLVFRALLMYFALVIVFNSIFFSLTSLEFFFASRKHWSRQGQLFLIFLLILGSASQRYSSTYASSSRVTSRPDRFRFSAPEVAEAEVGRM